MLDLFGIMFSSIVITLVLIRALQWDRTRPWFEAASNTVAKPGSEAPPSKSASRTPTPPVPSWRDRRG